ncbi:RagB/SusD family nutrient uptake outer membrane protein [Parachryseolinea silvisoli]|uniref:RagB/SusD family nutrient uptake outer membrane protein n=1 Tax=Parachryseolinea silvisoli TaxID=2873601 RepID=UPI002265BA53|nr:RagB/SusD family nutrient uptake outer membrane protein [Parachryseolinea silvisoli]MCD9020121.1 RagB/SusD family nutrient uptake outer membrane protein [Parachryseolinea silvisoli]
MFKKIFILYFVIGFTALVGCEDMIEIEAPLDQVVAEDVFKSDATAKSALSGLYGTFSQSQTQLQNLTVNLALAADELEYYQTVATYIEFATNTYLPSNGNVSGMFSDYYAAIYKANSLIEGVAQGSVTPALATRITAEAKFLRAYCYFHLVNLFGRIPLVLETDVNVTSILPRSNPDVIYEQIIRDLTEARADLAADYAVSTGSRVVPNKAAADAMLARVYLYTGADDLAEAAASSVIDQTALYTLVPQGNLATDVFSRDNKEAIMQFMGWGVSTNLYTYEASVLIPSSFATTATFGLSNDLIDAFGPDDARRNAWITQVIKEGVTYNIPYKYKNLTSTTVVAAGEYPTILRLAEQYLIRAEARARIGTNIASALADLNAIRTRAGLTESSTTDATALLDEIAEERRKELFLELGHRWFDLKRTGKIDDALNPIKPDWESTAALLPIPQAAVDANPALLPNNPGY